VRGDTNDLEGDILCQTNDERRCIESLYMTSDKSNESSGGKWIDKSSSSTTIYTTLGLFIFIPLALVWLLLYRRDKK